ncbi:hypothetical protein E6P09_07640 [Haloferax mediterranei ATCC 33500]|uniref:Uncharacterized protein n=1 Tax=Haloferax mediterranei (strain ATCC 33500 / DSM 1411 / JCM 8866 / NBRC 14739 / NCIMB 2177 / R-4) TaxID=523841 RepID=I3R330_HALMT|nr:hypothetical protein [Haloferax mediterranei]AFK18640.1 hypothetical protein HFX_0920 [Haloferax mediterranei ATCC 33500]AHZ21988.1 hypothetical protein BM92_04620 [Haloferax mediterranei ATCC 33500]EMA02084.1 hypothetical protein C439_05875 [Haloferax mediterranei ATCC 33500]MDX5988733.1 hypothetical protein [Haloferax mediterranei ATCC 33500]QCQ75140.1 hypothetical protein E6P09_07640 [Haloferax mediterranei ATCC 33500]
MSVLLVAMIFASTLAPFVGIATAAPSGLVGVPDANVSEDFPVDSNPSLRAADLEGSVMASDHAESLEVIATTPDRASDYVNGTTVGGGETVLVLRDDVHSTGRTVAIDAGALRDALGYTPERVFGTHDDGSEWSSPVRYEGGLLLFDVAHFSSNVVTFSGTVEVTATAATNGTSLDYSLNSVDAASNLTVEFTGRNAKGWDNESATGVTDGDSIPLSIGGDVNPSGPSANGKPVVEVSSQDGATGTHWTGSADNTGYLVYGGDNYGEIGFDLGYTKVSGITLPLNNKGDHIIDVYLINEAPDSKYGEADATLVKQDWSPSSSGNQTISFSPVDVDPTKPVTFEFVVTNSASGGLELDTNSTLDDDIDGYLASYGGAYVVPRKSYLHGAPGTFNASVTGPSGTIDLSTTNGTARGELPLTSSTSSISFSDSDGYSYGVDILLEEQTATSDPGIGLNGHTQTYSGSLAEGESVTVPMNDSWLTTGTNNVTVTTGSAPSADAPRPVVDVVLNHTAQDDQTVTYSGGKWTESYNVSRTYSTDTKDSILTIPFASNVASLKNIERRTNGGSWSTVAPGDYSLDGTTLTVELGTVDGGDTVSIRTTGQRVVAVNGSLTVTDPTPLGERLDSEIRIDSWSNDSYISLGGSPDEGRLHYTYNESFGDTEFDKVTSTGYHRLHLPGASTSSTFRVSTIPVRVNVATGESRFRITEPSTTEPKISVSPGAHTSDGVTYTFLSPSAGDKYILYSTTVGTQRDSALAEETVSLKDDDSEEILVIRKSESSDATGSGGFFTDGGSVASAAGDYVPAMPVLNPGLVAAIVLVIIAGAIAYTERRVSSSRTTPVYERPMVLLALVVAGFVGVLLISPESITGPIQSALDTALPLAAVLGVMLAAGGLGYWWYTRRKARIAEAKAPETVFQIGGDKK